MRDKQSERTALISVGSWKIIYVVLFFAAWAASLLYSLNQMVALYFLYQEFSAAAMWARSMIFASVVVLSHILFYAVIVCHEIQTRQRKFRKFYFVGYSAGFLSPLIFVPLIEIFLTVEYFPFVVSTLVFTFYGMRYFKR